MPRAPPHPWVTYSVALLPHQLRFPHCPHCLSPSPREDSSLPVLSINKWLWYLVHSTGPALLLWAAESQVHTTVSMETEHAFTKQDPFLH